MADTASLMPGRYMTAPQAEEAGCTSRAGSTLAELIMEHLA